MRNTIAKTFIAWLALGLACAAPLAPVAARGGHGGGGGGPDLNSGGGGHEGGFHGGGGHEGGVGPGIGLGVGGLAAGGLVGSYDPYYGNCSGYPTRYDQYGRRIDQC